MHLKMPLGKKRLVIMDATVFWLRQKLKSAARKFMQQRPKVWNEVRALKMNLDVRK